MKNRSVIAIMHGGLGNQMFIYAAARALALRRGVGLAFDVTSGFRRDFYRRRLSLHHFVAPVDTASSWARRWFAWRVLRRWARWRSVQDRRPERSYWVDPENGFVQAVHDHPVLPSVYLDGYWQSERYFADAAPVIRSGFALRGAPSEASRRIAEKIESCDAICVHGRRLRSQRAGESAPASVEPGLGISYYRKAILELAAGCRAPQVFCFSDLPEFFRDSLDLPLPVRLVTHNQGDDRSYEDLWLMSRCAHFVLADSSFSWWGAWLANRPGKRVIYPELSSWGWTANPDMMPAAWEGRSA